MRGMTKLLRLFHNVENDIDFIVPQRWDGFIISELAAVVVGTSQIVLL